MRLDRRRTTCTVEGHGTRCVVARERVGERFPRCTVEGQALAYERGADPWERGPIVAAPMTPPSHGGPAMKSSFSDITNCVDVEFVDPGTHAREKDGQPVAVVVRDTNDATGKELWFTAGEWDAFLAGAKAGEFDRDANEPGSRRVAEHTEG